MADNEIRASELQAVTSTSGYSMIIFNASTNAGKRITVAEAIDNKISSASNSLVSTYSLADWVTLKNSRYTIGGTSYAIQPAINKLITEQNTVTEAVLSLGIQVRDIGAYAAVANNTSGTTTTTAAGIFNTGVDADDFVVISAQITSQAAWAVPYVNPTNSKWYLKVFSGTDPLASTSVKWVVTTIANPDHRVVPNS